MTDAETTALVERARLSMRLVLIAASREVEAMRSGDHRYAKTSDAVRRIAGTMDQVSDDVLLKLATANQLSEGPLSTLIATRLSEVGGALPLYEDACDPAPRTQAPQLIVPSGFIEPCLPSKVARPPSDPRWVHEIKHDGYRLMVGTGRNRPLADSK